MSNRFHNKYHRASHHTFKDPSVPDSGYDPIASSDKPFLGNFHLSGTFYPSGFPVDIYALTSYIQNLTSLNIQALSTIYTDFLNVNYLNVNYFETSGFGLSGSEVSLFVPTVHSLQDTLTLNGIGLTGNRWASFVGDIVSMGTVHGAAVEATTIIGNTLSGHSLVVDTISSTGGNIDIYSDVDFNDNDITHVSTLSSTTINSNSINTINLAANNIEANTGSTININDNVNAGANSISANYGAFDTVFANTYLGIVSNDYVFNVFNGWDDPVTITNSPSGLNNLHVTQNDQFTCLASALPTKDANINITVQTSAFDGYIEVYAIIGNYTNQSLWKTVGGAKIGNLGLLPNADVEHASVPGLWIDNEATFSFIAPSSNTMAWFISTRNVYGDNVVNGVIFEQRQTQITVANTTIDVNTLNAANLSAQSFYYRNSVVDTGQVFSNAYLTVFVGTSTLYIPLYHL